MTRASLVVICLLLLIAPVVAQTPATPPQQQAGQPPKSTALIVGRVVDGTTGQPIPEAIVTMVPPGGRGRAGMPAFAGATPEMQQAIAAAAAAASASAGRGNTQQRIMTGGDGRFVFHDLPPGQFQLSATLTGYTSDLGVTMSPSLAGVMGGVSASTSSTAIALKEGEFATGVTLKLWKFAVVSGTVVDDGGEPAIGLTVQLARKVNAGGRVRYVPAWSSKTDDRGAYRISSVVPGEYIVAVPQAQVSMPTAIMTGLVDGMKSGNMMGGGMVAIMDLMSSGVMPTDTMAGGVRFGDYMVASSGSVPLIGPDGHLLAYQTTFYPGAGVPAQASIVKLGSGDERGDVNFQLRLTATSRVSGVATGPDGPVANLGIRLVVPADGVVSESEFEVATAITKADGAFSFYGVPPGQFLLKAQKQPRPDIPAEALAGNPAAAALLGGGGIAGSKAMLFASVPISVSTADIDGLSLQLQSGYRVAGHVEFQSATGRPAPPPQQVQSLVIALSPVDGRLPNMMAMANVDRPNAQADFQTKGYEPGKYFLTLTAGGGWQVKSATFGGRDILDNPLELRDADVSGVSVIMTDKVGQVNGTVRAAGETDLSETAILLFPYDYRSWAENGMNPRRSRTVRASRSGSFTMPGVPPGEYFIIAVDREAGSNVPDLAGLDALLRGATRVTVTDEAATVSLVKVRVGK